MNLILYASTRHGLGQRGLRLRRGLLLLAVLGQVGCAGPQVARWSAPSGGPKPQATNLDGGRAYADAARAAYHQAVVDFGQSQAELSNLLLGTGALATALAVAKVHRDVLTGTAFLGGTAYGWGSMNLSKQRSLIYLAGVDAVNCAKRAVAPLSMTTVEQQGLDDALALQEGALRALDSSRAALRRATPAQLGDKDKAAVDAALAASAAALEAAQRLQLAGRQLARNARSASEQLIQAVDRIDATILRATLDTLPDLSSVAKVVGGLSGFAASFAPGAGIDTTINNALAERGKAAGVKAQSGLTGGADPAAAGTNDVLVKAVDALAIATDSLLAASASVQSRLAGHESALVADALKDCGIAELAFPLRGSSDRIAFAGGAAATKTVVISGGTKPYVVELQDSVVDGLAIKAPAPFESRVQVSISAAVKPPQTFSLLVMDSSNPMKTLVLPIEVGVAAPKSESGASAKTDAPAVATTLDALGNLLNKKDQYPGDDGVVLVMADNVTLQSGATELVVKLRCKPVPKVPMKASRVRALLLTGAGLAADHALAAQLKPSAPPNCMAAGT